MRKSAIKSSPERRSGIKPVEDPKDVSDCLAMTVWPMQTSV